MKAMDLKLKKIIMLALLTAFVCVATLVLQIPSPTGGYVNFGDCIILITAWLLGPWYGAVAGAVGSGLADLFAGYVAYVPGTFVIKGIIGLLAGFLSLLLKKKIKGYISRIIGGFVAEVWMALGYFIFTSLILGKGIGALASVPGNLIQGGVSLVVAIIIFQMLSKAGLNKEL